MPLEITTFAPASLARPRDLHHTRRRVANAAAADA